MTVSDFDVQHVTTVMRIAYSAIAMRALLFMVTIMGAVAFGFSMALGTWRAFACACAFSVLIFLPVLFRTVRKESDHGPVV